MITAWYPASRDLAYMLFDVAAGRDPIAELRARKRQPVVHGE